MATRVQERVIRRVSLPLTARDETGLGLVRTSRRYQRALERLGAELHGGAETVSEGALLHAVFAAGWTRCAVELRGQL